MSENTKKDIIKIAIALSVLAIFIGINLYSNYRSAKAEFEASKEKQTVTDNSRYFTVIGCINKFLNYVQSGNKEDVLLLLNEEYKTDYSVTLTNINNFIPNLEGDGIYEYSGEDMYFRKISKNVTEYYVNGNIQQSFFGEESTSKPYDFTVILYEDKFLFSIKPGDK